MAQLMFNVTRHGQPLSRRGPRYLLCGAPASKFSTYIVERNNAFEVAARIENPNLARAKACAANGVVNCISLVQKHGLNTGTFVHLPSVSVWSDFDDCHGKGFAFSAKGVYMFI